jgi:hypothetical protein
MMILMRFLVRSEMRLVMSIVKIRGSSVELPKEIFHVEVKTGETVARRRGSERLMANIVVLPTFVWITQYIVRFSNGSKFLFSTWIFVFVRMIFQR